MAGLRNGALFAVLLVATAFLAAAVSSAEAYSWDEFLTDQQAKHEQSDMMDVQAAASTTKFPAKGYTVVIDSKGKGKYKTIQAAIDAVPVGNKKRIIFDIRDGVYRQKIKIPSTKAGIYFRCQSRKVVITWNDDANKAGGTALSASTAVESDWFIASDCTFQNSAPAPPGGAVGKQAVALRIQGDFGAFYRCGFLGAQDTLYDKEGRHFFRSCEIVGSIDWIFGDGQSFYQYCKLTSIAKANSGSVTAQKRESNSKTGFVFFQCSIGGSGSIYLGRAWGVYSRVIFYQCQIANMIRPEGWQDWNDPKRRKTIFYAEYKCSGPGASRKGREKWSLVLTDKQAAPFATTSFIDGKSWLGEKI